MKEEITINSLKKAGFIEFREHKHESINSDAIRLEEPVQFSPEELNELFENGKGKGLYFDNSRCLHTHSVVKINGIDSFVAETMRLDEPIRIDPRDYPSPHIQTVPPICDQKFWDNEIKKIAEEILNKRHKT